MSMMRFKQLAMAVSKLIIRCEHFTEVIPKTSTQKLQTSILRLFGWKIPTKNSTLMLVLANEQKQFILKTISSESHHLIVTVQY